MISIMQLLGSLQMAIAGTAYEGTRFLDYRLSTKDQLIVILYGVISLTSLSISHSQNIHLPLELIIQVLFDSNIMPNCINKFHCVAGNGNLGCQSSTAIMVCHASGCLYCFPLQPRPNTDSSFPGNPLSWRYSLHGHVRPYTTPLLFNVKLYIDCKCTTSN